MDVEARTAVLPNLSLVPSVVRSGIDSDIVCACSGITRSDIDLVIDRLQGAGEPVTKGKIFRALGRRSNCGGCFAAMTDALPKTSGPELPIFA